MEMEANAGANITVINSEAIENLDWVELERTNFHIKGYDGIAKECLGKFELNLQSGSKSSEEWPILATQRLPTSSPETIG